MVLYDPMERPLLQLVTSHPATNKKLFPRRAPAWAGDITKLSNAQLRSCYAFAQYGINNLRGVTGTTSYNGNTVSEAAMKVMEEYPKTGQGAFGGKSPKERRQDRYARAESTRDKLQQEMNNRGVSVQNTYAPDGGRPMTDGGVDETEH